MLIPKRKYSVELEKFVNGYIEIDRTAIGASISTFENMVSTKYSDPIFIECSKKVIDVYNSIPDDSGGLLNKINELERFKKELNILVKSHLGKIHKNDILDALEEMKELAVRQK